MKIGIDGNEANVPKLVGSGTYTYQLLKYFYREDHDFHIFLKNSPKASLKEPTTNWHYHRVLPKKFWIKFSLPLSLKLKHSDLDVFFSPAHYSPSFLDCPLVVTVHDVAYEYYPEQFLPQDLFKLRKWTASSVENAAKIIAVSENTKKDIIKYYGVNESKIEVIHNGYDKKAFHEKAPIKKDVLNKYGINGNYLLYVGTIQPRKNVLKLVQAFHILKSNKSYKGQLVIAGNPGWMSDDIIRSIKESKYINDIVLTGYVPEKELPTLYRAADAFILPSLYEGFGIPALESMACKTPVAVSDNSSLPEVVGDAGVLFDPNDPADISESILELLANLDKYTKLSLKQIQNFSWEKTAENTLKVIESSVK